MLVTMNAVPRRSEGVRQVVDYPWEYFALLPTALALATILLVFGGISFAGTGTRTSRLVWLIAAAVALVLCSLFCLPLLRRDYLGKF